MNATAPLPTMPSTPTPPHRSGLLHSQRTLTLLGLFMLTLMLPTLVALGLDERTLRGVPVWVKPLKFMASLALFALSTAWFIGLLEPAQRQTRAVRFSVWVIVVCGLGEVGYISLQAARGQASHFNFADWPHALAYQMMGLGALALCATQGVLARQLSRHARPDLNPQLKQGVVLGLWLTLALGAGAGGLLGSMQPPAGSGLPLFGWHAAGDLRPAHFLGMHAQQLLPLAGLAFSRWPQHSGRRALLVVAALYVAAWLVLMAMGLHGGRFIQPALLMG